MLLEFVGLIISAIITGAIIGALARLALPGKQNISIAMTVVIGIVGAIVGGLLARLVGFGGGTGGFSAPTLIIEILLAAAGVAIMSRRSKSV